MSTTLHRLVMESVIPAALLAAACSQAAVETSTSTTTTTTTTLPPVSVNRLVVLGDDGNVFTIDPDGTGRAEVTEDAGGPTVYFQPVWSPDGSRVAFGGADGAAFHLTIASQDGTNLEATTMDSFPFFYYWDAASDKVGLLRNAAGGGLAMEVIEDGVLSRVETGAPFYFSWDPLGTGLVWHIGTDRLEIRGDDGSTTSLDDEPGAFQAPQWTEAGIFFATSDGDEQHLVRLEGGAGGEAITVADMSGFALFSANAAGTHIAVQGLRAAPDATTVAFQQTPRVPLNQLAVIDVATGDIERVTDGPAIAFFWNPQGDSLLVLTGGDEPATVTWSMWSEGSTTELATFSPSPTFLRDYLPFFDQYAQSMTLWSPEGDRFTFPGRIGSDRGIWVQSVDGSSPTRVSEGVFAAWSPH